MCLEVYGKVEFHRQSVMSLTTQKQIKSVGFDNTTVTAISKVVCYKREKISERLCVG
jgi:hypothetical protein